LMACRGMRMSGMAGVLAGNHWMDIQTLAPMPSKDHPTRPTANPDGARGARSGCRGPGNSAGPGLRGRPPVPAGPRDCSHYFSKCEWVENSANLGARRRPDWMSGLGVQQRVALFSTHSLRVAAKNAMRGVAKPCRGATPAAFRALRMAFLIRNASWKNSVNRT
jgi:hypothetical protein